MKNNNNNWVPEIMYEESEEGSSHIPFIMVPQNQVMPRILFIFESRQTDVTEPGLEGEEVPVFEWDLHQYADMAVLKEKLNPVVYDSVRDALGLEPLASAYKKGKKIGEKVRTNLSL